MPQRHPVLILVIALAALLPLIVRIAAPFFTPFILALVVAIVVHPANERLTFRLRRRGLAALVTTFVAVLVLAVVVALVGLTLTRELTAAYNELNQRSLEEGGWPALATATVDRIVGALSSTLPVSKEAIRSEILARLKTASGYVLGALTAAVGGLTTAIIAVVLVTLFLYFLLRYGQEWLVRFAGLIPLDASTTGRVIKAVHDSVVANVNGVLAVATGQGLLLILGFWFVGLRSPVLWGALGGLASVIPVVGAPLVWLPIALAFVFQGSYGKALILGLWGSLVAGSADNVLRGFVVGGRERQHPMLIALAAIGGTYAFGALGILLGPLTISLATALIKEIQHISSGESSVKHGPEPRTDPM